MTTTVAADFSVLQVAIMRQFERLPKDALFRVNLSGDELWQTYLESFPPGTNPIYQTRREYDCSCCKSFIRAVGNMVAVLDHQFDHQLMSIWDIEPTGVPEFDTVTSALSRLVHSHAICDIFLHREASAGQMSNRVLNGDGTVQTFQHFYLSLPSTAFRLRGRDEALGIARTNHDVFVRSLDEISTEALDTVIDLIKQNSLYRGCESQQNVIDFYQVKRYSGSLPPKTREQYLWKMSQGLRSSVTHIKNTSIGTLLVDLSNGMDLDAAVLSHPQTIR